MSEPFNYSEWNYKRYLRDQQELQAYLDALPGTLADRVIALHDQQLDIGFIRDKLESVHRTNLVNPNGEESFIAQYNPKRALRFAGYGRKDPPNGVVPINGGCFLCAENIYWQQFGLEMGYRFAVNGRDYIAWCNPFPFMQRHVTIASATHEPQTWIGEDDLNRERAHRLIDDQLAIAEQMPNFVIFYNGDGAGASIKGHRHYHGFLRSFGQEPFPLEKSAIAQLNSGEPPFEVHSYPITSIYCQDDKSVICDQAVNFIDDWTETCGSSKHLSANVIASTELKPRTTEVDYHKLFFTPRNTYYSTASGRSETIAGLEVLGEIAFSQEEEYRRLIAGQIDYQYVRQMLRSVEAPEAHALLARKRGRLHLRS